MRRGSWTYCPLSRDMDILGGGPELMLSSLFQLFPCAFPSEGYRPSVFLLCCQFSLQREKNVNSHFVRGGGFIITASPSSPRDRGKSSPTWICCFVTHKQLCVCVCNRTRLPHTGKKWICADAQLQTTNLSLSDRAQMLGHMLVWTKLVLSTIRTAMVKRHQVCA